MRDLVSGVLVSVSFLLYYKLNGLNVSLSTSEKIFFKELELVMAISEAKAEAGEVHYTFASRYVRSPMPRFLIILMADFLVIFSN